MVTTESLRAVTNNCPELHKGPNSPRSFAKELDLESPKEYSDSTRSRYRFRSKDCCSQGHRLLARTLSENRETPIIYSGGGLGVYVSNGTPIEENFNLTVFLEKRRILFATPPTVENDGNWNGQIPLFLRNATALR